MSHTTTRRSTAAREATLRRLSCYAASSLGTAICGTSVVDAAIVPINVVAIGLSGTNAGLTNGTEKLVYFPGPNTTYQLFAMNRSGGDPKTGLQPYGVGVTGPQMYVGLSALAYASPKKFGPGATVGAGSAAWAIDGKYTAFNYYGNSAPTFGPNSYLAFRMTPNIGATAPLHYYYGYLETLWDSTTGNFQFLAGAYESTVDTPIVTPVPEPSAAAAVGLGALALGAGAIRRSRRARRERVAV